MNETAEKRSDINTVEITKTLPEIRRAHNLLVAALLADGGEPATADESASLALGPIGLTEGQFADVAAYASVMCWLLGHEYNHSFARNMEILELMLRQQHFVIGEDGNWQMAEAGPVQ
jgi:hypothetical protein